MAQAILHDPAILILDEPTSGLDPNQQLEVLQLIQNLKQKKTVLLSTHILSEAQAVCDRVLIINRGKIVADGTPALLSQSATHGHRVTVEWKAPAEAARAAVAALPAAPQVTVQRDEDGRVTLLVESSEHDLREDIFALAVREHWVLLQLTPESVSLDDVFRQLTTQRERSRRMTHPRTPAARGDPRLPRSDASFEFPVHLCGRGRFSDFDGVAFCVTAFLSTDKARSTPFLNQAAADDFLRL